MTLLLVASCILQNTQKQVLISERPKHKFMAGYWEFPGGKVEEGENVEEAAIREIKEELGLVLQKEDLDPFSFICHSYEKFDLLMLVYLVKKWANNMESLEGQNLAWVLPTDLDKYPILPADLPLCKKLGELP